MDLCLKAKDALRLCIETIREKQHVFWWREAEDKIFDAITDAAKSGETVCVCWDFEEQTAKYIRMVLIFLDYDVVLGRVGERIFVQADWGKSQKGKK